MAYVLQVNSNRPQIPTNNDLEGLLSFAAASRDINECRADRGTHTTAFSSLTLTTGFTNVKLTSGGFCLTEQVGNPSTLTLAIGNCLLWSTGNTRWPGDLIFDDNQCIKKAPTDTGIIVILSDSATGGCLKFIYERDPFTGRGTSYPSEISTPRPWAPFGHGNLDDLVTGLIGVTGASGEMQRCLISTTGGFVFSTGQPGRQWGDCMRFTIDMQ